MFPVFFSFPSKDESAHKSDNKPLKHGRRLKSWDLNCMLG
jgi:hypothetical protein